MGHKFQDSTPIHATWNAGDKNKALPYYSWGYDSILVAFDVPKSITGGSIVFEGYLGYADEDATKWGDWYQVGAYDASDEKLYKEYDLSEGSKAFYATIIGFSQCRARLTSKLEGEGSVHVGLACHAANWR